MKHNQDISCATATQPLHRQSNATGSSSAKARLLLVEDHDVNQILIQAMTKQLGYETVLASDGTEAVAHVTRSMTAKDQFDLVLMDIQMPFMDGYEATRIIRKSGITPKILPIIAITANAFDDDIRNCLEAGMQAHIPKPVDISILESALRYWLKSKQTENEKAPKQDTKSDFSDDLLRRYRKRREEAIQSIVSFVDQGTFSNSETRKIQDQLHKLAGTAAMFGERELGNHAKSIEEGLQQWKITERPEKMRNALGQLLNVA